MRGLGLAVAALVIILGGAGGFSAVRLSAISSQPLSFAAAEPNQNILILGYGGGDHPGAYLSDSMVLVVEDGGTQAEISIPRDLWVQLPPSSGHYEKINAALADGQASGGLDAGGNLAAEKVQQVTGLPVTGWVLQDFDGFRQMVDAIGGVDINVQRAFSAQYPVNDDPSINASWKVVHFDAGPQHMDGERALEFARARYADVPAEASDFARSQRQQLLVSAIRAKAISPTGAIRFLPLVNALAGSVHTNLPPLQLARFVASFHTDQAKHIDLSSVLVNGQSGDGQDILLPRNSDYSLIVNDIRQQLQR